MQTIDLNKADILTLRQVVDCLTDASETVSHCADNHMSVELVMQIVEAALLGKAKWLHQVAPQKYGKRPPWALPDTRKVEREQKRKLLS